MCESISLIYFDKIIIYYYTTTVANKTNIQTVYYCYMFRDQKGEDWILSCLHMLYAKHRTKNGIFKFSCGLPRWNLRGRFSHRGGIFTYKKMSNKLLLSNNNVIDEIEKL